MGRNRRSRISSRVSFLAIPASAAFFLGGHAAQADLIVQVLDSSANAGGTGSFDVILQETNNGPDEVNSHTLQLSIDSSKGITFTGATAMTDPTNEPYVYGGSGSPSTSGFPSTSFTYADGWGTNPPFETNMNSGDIFGAAHVTYSVAPGTPSEVVPVTLGSSGTQVNDIVAGPIALTLTNGSITVTGQTSTAHPIIKLASSAPTGYGSQITNGSGSGKGAFSPNNADNKLDVTGGNGSYTLAQVTGIGGSTATAYIEAHGFNPNTNSEIFALDVADSLGQATNAELTALLSAINGTDGVAPASQVTASLTSPAPNPFTSKYNLFLTFSGTQLPSGIGTPADDLLGFDLSQANDSNLVGLSVSSVALIPEPMSLGLMCLGGVGLLAQRKTRRCH